jgi:dynein heavy chain, axonemal
VEASLEKRQGRTYGPPGGKSMTLLLDDLSMPAANEWGDQPTNELLRQLLESGGFYSLDKPVGDAKAVADVRVVAAMAAPGGGRQDVPNRLKGRFCAFAVPAPSEGEGEKGH